MYIWFYDFFYRNYTQLNHIDLRHSISTESMMQSFNSRAHSILRAKVNSSFAQCGRPFATDLKFTPIVTNFVHTVLTHDALTGHLTPVHLLQRYLSSKRIMS